MSPCPTSALPGQQWSSKKWLWSANKPTPGQMIAGVDHTDRESKGRIWLLAAWWTDKNKVSGIMVIRENTVFISQGGHSGFVFTAGFCSRSERPDPPLHRWPLFSPYPFLLPPLCGWSRGGAVDPWGHCARNRDAKKKGLISPLPGSSWNRIPKQDSLKPIIRDFQCWPWE